MERLTNTDIGKVCFDTWELCGLDNVCKRSCREPEPCKIPQMIYRLAMYENTGLTPEDAAALRAELDAVKRERDAAVSLIYHSCGTCLYVHNSWNDEPCKSCTQNDDPNGDGEDNYKWRGTQEVPDAKEAATD